MSFKRSIKSTWMLFEASQEPKFSIIFHRVLFIAVPIILSIGVGSTLANAANSVSLGVFFGLVCLVLLYFGMTTISSTADEQVKKHEGTLPVDPDLEYVKTFESTSRVQPAYYQGVGEWVCQGHVPPSEFIESILEYDRFLSTINYQTLEDSLQYNYAAKRFSPRHHRNVLKIVNKTDNGAFPVTRLKAPYDFYPVAPPFLSNSGEYTLPNPSEPITLIQPATDPIEPQE